MDESNSEDREAVGFPTPWELGVGYFTNFLDTLGIGSFATTTALFRFKKMVDDRVIPGTLNVGHFLPTVAQTFIYTTLIEVDIPTLFSLIAAAAAGAWLGAGVVARWSKRAVQIGMAMRCSLPLFCSSCRQRDLFPGGGDAIGVRGTKLADRGCRELRTGRADVTWYRSVCAVYDSRQSARNESESGVPDHDGLMRFSDARGKSEVHREKSYDARAALGLAIGGVPAVLVAAYIVRELDLNTVRWLVIVVVVYAAISMLLAARAEKRATRGAIPAHRLTLLSSGPARPA